MDAADPLAGALAAFDRGDAPYAPLTTSEVADALDCTRRTAYNRLDRLAERGDVETKKVGARGRVWWRPPDESDAAESKRAGAERELLYSTIRSIAEAETFEDGLRATLREVCEATDWEIGEAWIPSDGVLERASVSYAAASDLESFSAVSDEVTFESDEGLPGRVWASGDAEWMADVTTGTETTYPRRGDAVDAGIKSAVGVPITTDGEVVAVLAFLMTEPRPTDETTTELVSSVATELGEFVERRRAEDALERETELTERILETSPVGVGVFDTDGEITRANAQAATLLGLTDDEAETYAAGGVEALDADGRPIPYEQLPVARVLDGSEEVVDREMRLETDDEFRWVSINAAPLTDEEGSLERVVATVADVTPLKEQARQLERELDEMFERVDDAFFALDDEWRFTYVNERAEDVLERSASELRGRVLWEAIPAANDSVREHYERAMATQEQVDVEVFSEPLSRWVEISAYPSESGLSVYFRDVTERKQRERRLERYETVVETVNDGVYAVDEDGEFVLVNDAYAEMTGYDSADLLGNHVSLVVDADTVARALDHERELKAGEGGSGPVEADLHTAEGETFPAEASFSLLSEGEEALRVGVVRDVTERKARERELERYETVFETIWDGVYALDDDERFVMANEAFLELTDYDREELLGEPGSMVHDETINETAGNLAAEVVEGRRSGAALEFDLRTADGDAVPVESRFGPYQYDEDTYARTGVVRDVTERKQFEETLTSLNDSTRRLLAAETRAEVNRVVVDTATEVLDLSGVIVYRNDPERDVLAPAERSVEASFMRREFPEVPRGEGSITGRTFAEGRTRCYDDVTDHRDIRVDPADTDMRSGLFVPMADHGILVVGSPEVGAFDDDTRQLVEILAANAEAAYDRVAREERLKHQRGQLEALDALNGVVRDINEALVRQSTREEVEQVVCDRLADSESYRFAWVGEPDPKRQRVRLSAEAGVEGYLDDAEISTDPADPNGQGPTGRAVRTQEMQVTRNVESDADYETWRDHADRHDFRSSAAIPIVHDGTLYGVLNVYAGRPAAFEGEERVVIGQLGETVGHAIASIERKRMLMSDEVVELEFQIRDVFDAFDVSLSDESIRFERTVPLGDGEYLEYGTATGDARETLAALADETDHWESASVVSEGFGTARFELRLSEPPVVSAVAAHGGYVNEASVEDGDYHMAIHLPNTADVRSVTDRIREAYPTAEVVTRRQVAAGDSTERVVRALADDLTERQRATLEAAYFAGFFEWPRETDGKAVADSLGITDSTFHQHVRKAEGKILDALLAEPSATIR